MKKWFLVLVKLTLLVTVIIGCGSGGKSTTSVGVRQSGVTISASPVFPYDPLMTNQYTLLVSNHTAQEVSLVDSKILNSSLAESITLSDIVDSSNCQELAAGANCRLAVKLPYVKTNGYINFRLDYQAKSDGKNYPIDKLIAFSRGIPESNGLVYSLKYSEKIIVNSDKFTFALPLSLKQDYTKLELQLADQKDGYSGVNCDSESGYNKRSNCTALIELDSHIAHPKLSLKTTDKNGFKNTINLKLNVEYNNTAHLVYLNAPVVVKATDSVVDVIVMNIGTAAATEVTTPWEKADDIDLTQKSDCARTLGINEICTLSYEPRLGNLGGVGTLQQIVSYIGGAQGFQRDQFKVYRSPASLEAPQIESIYPAHNQVIDEIAPIITVTFSQPVDSTTVNNNSFYVTLGDDWNVLRGTIEFSASNVITFKPAATDLSGYGDLYIHLKTNQLGNRAGKVSPIADASEVTSFSIREPIKVSVFPDTTAKVMMGGSFQFSADIHGGGSTGGSSTVTAAFANPLDGIIISSNLTPCALSTSGISHCNFSAVVTGYQWNSGLANGLTSSSYQIVVSASGVAQVGYSPLSFTMLTPTVYLPASGQTSTEPIAASEGMDGWTQTGVSMDLRFTRGSDATANCITDNLTGLMWIRDLNTVNGGNSATWQGALDFIHNANAAGGFCGYNDWSLPTVKELVSLINDGQADQLNWLQSQGFTNVSGFGYYWSSSYYAPDPGRAWVVVFDQEDGYERYEYVTSRSRFWPVRRIR